MQSKQMRTMAYRYSAFVFLIFWPSAFNHDFSFLTAFLSSQLGLKKCIISKWLSKDGRVCTIYQWLYRTYIKENNLNHLHKWCAAQKIQQVTDCTTAQYKCRTSTWLQHTLWTVDEMLIHDRHYHAYVCHDRQLLSNVRCNNYKFKLKKQGNK